MYICITNSHARKRLRTLGSRVLYDKETVYVLQYTIHPLNARENIFFVNFTVADTLKKCDI